MESFVLLKFAGEVLLYWVQHLLIFFIVPPYLIYTWGMLNDTSIMHGATTKLDVHFQVFSPCNFIIPGPQSLEPFGEWAWCCFGGILFGIHNHYVLQPIAIVSLVFAMIIN